MSDLLPTKPLRPLIQWSSGLALTILLIVAHQLWIAACVRENITVGGTGDPDAIFPRFMLLVLLMEFFALLVCSGGFIESLVKFFMDRRRRKEMVRKGWPEQDW